MMRTAGIAFILLGLTALWAYNTGRLEAILKIVKDPTFAPGKTQTVAGLGTIPVNPTGPGFSTVPIVGGGTDWAATIGGIFGGLLGAL